MEATMKRNEALPKLEAVKQKDRHIVTWTPQEDDILREQISIHGAASWTTIAAHFKDKSSRQCRRRWYTYLNSDCKKGGWSAEEDALLCEAQKIFGNRWTEIAKVVSGRTDNAVKNRFSTICKKRARHGAVSKENNCTTMNQNSKRVIVQNEFIRSGESDSIVPSKKIRTHTTDLTEEISPKAFMMMNTDSSLSSLNRNVRDRSFRECGSMKQQQRPPLAVLVSNSNNMGASPTVHHAIDKAKSANNNIADNKKAEGTFLKKDDPKITALMQQAELLSSLALKVSTQTSTESLENAWKEIQDFLAQSEETESLRSKIAEMDFLFGNFKDLVADFKSSNTESQPSWRQSELCDESQDSSEYSTGSTHQSHPEDDKAGHDQIKECSISENVNNQAQVGHGGLETVGAKEDGYCTGTSTVQVAFTEPKDDVGTVSALANTDFSSPLQMIPLFRSFAEGIPSPEFSDSERQFILSTLGVVSPSPNPNTNTPNPLHPPCKRAILHNL